MPSSSCPTPSSGPRTSPAGPIGLTVAAGLFSSNGEARRALSQGGVSVNEERLSGVDAVLPAPIGGRYLILRSGKKTYRIVRVEPA